ncbi:MAG: AbrB/MazE/SpoVT family DNA-binding domain-containing protein [bacterium]|nr:AbrB/MazE/SpoVT family DNA-binding domain-containing protein [bacterium]
MSTLTKKGQVTIPKGVRDALGLRPGMRVAFELREGEAVLRKQVDPQHIARWRGYLKPHVREGTDELLTRLR